MQIRLTFLGGAQNVTGSRYLLETSSSKFLVDCGLFQERQYLERNWLPFEVLPKNLDAILLTHAHLDHCGLVPKLVKEGFKNPIYCTSATAEILKIIIMDSAKLQVEDAEFKKRRHEREARKGRFPEIPLYTTEDAEATFPLISSTEYNNKIKIGDGVEATFHDAGHILGSSMIEIRVKQGQEERVIIFSGDIGRPERPLLNDPTIFKEADYVVMESTYGNRLLDTPDQSAEVLADVINSTVKIKGNIVIPSFALERAQEVLYHLNKLKMQSKIPNLMVFLDSPMAVSVTDVFEHHIDLLDEEMQGLISHNNSPFHFSGLHLVRSIEESKAINQITGTIIIIAGSGMCNGGRIKHHLVRNITRPESAILFVGYQAEGTLGRQIVDGATKVRILGQSYPVLAQVNEISGFSSHADQAHLLNWLSWYTKPPKSLFITHGEKEATNVFAKMVKEKLGWSPVVPNYNETVLLS
jgi:metallo-beta-lactamase family protein